MAVVAEPDMASPGLHVHKASIETALSPRVLYLVSRTVVCGSLRRSALAPQVEGSDDEQALLVSQRAGSIGPEHLVEQGVPGQAGSNPTDGFKGDETVHENDGAALGWSWTQ